MYVIQEGMAEVVNETDRGEVLIALRGKGQFFDEMAIFEQELRSATVRAMGDARVLTIDKKTSFVEFMKTQRWHSACCKCCLLVFGN